jgi:hypothetical protein
MRNAEAAKRAKIDRERGIYPTQPTGVGINDLMPPSEPIYSVPAQEPLTATAAVLPGPPVVIVGEQPECKCYTTKVTDYGAVMSGCDLDWKVTEDCPLHRTKK